MKTFSATLKSTSPISFGRYYAQDVPKKDRESAADYEERTWRERLHVAEDGRVFIPPFAFKNCLDSAAKYLGKQIPGRGKNTFTKHFVSGLLVMDPLILPMRKNEVKGEWRYVPADGMPGGSKRVMKCFPVISKWEGIVETLRFKFWTTRSASTSCESTLSKRASSSEWEHFGPRIEASTDASVW